MHYEWTVAASRAGKRLDIFLKERIPGKSRAFLQARVRGGSVTVNGKRASSDARIRTGDIIAAEFEETYTELVPETRADIPVLFEDPDIIVINKPAGIVAHPLLPEGKGTLANWVLAHYPEVRGVGDSPLRPGMAHRLDKHTSGVMVFAKSSRAYDALKKIFHDRLSVKIYKALLERAPAEPEGIIEGYLSASPQEHRHKNFTKLPLADRSKFSRSRYKVMGRCGPGCLAEFIPETGRTHQIRAHASSLGAPVLGDTLYGAHLALPAELAGRFYLHAFRLTFVLPWWSKERMYEAPVPPEFDKAREWLARQ